MKLDFKKMSVAQIVVFAAAASVVLFAFIALIVSLCMHGSAKSMMESMYKHFSIFGRHNPLSGLNWALFLTFFCSLCIGAVHFFKPAQSKLIPEVVPMKFVVPGVIVTAFLFVWIYLGTSYDSVAFMEGKGTFAAILALLFLLLYVGVFGLFAFEKKDNLMEMLPSAVLALGGLFLLIAVIRCLCYPGMAEAAVNAAKAGKDAIPSPLGLVKTGMIINSLCFTGWACLTVLGELKEEEK